MPVLTRQTFFTGPADARDLKQSTVTEESRSESFSGAEVVDLYHIIIVFSSVVNSREIHLKSIQIKYTNRCKRKVFRICAQLLFYKGIFLNILNTLRLHIFAKRIIIASFYFKKKNHYI